MKDLVSESPRAGDESNTFGMFSSSYLMKDFFIRNLTDLNLNLIFCIPFLILLSLISLRMLVKFDLMVCTPFLILIGFSQNLGWGEEEGEFRGDTLTDIHSGLKVQGNFFHWYPPLKF